MGYALNSYRLWDPIKEKKFQSRDVIFDNQSIVKPIVIHNNTNDETEEPVLELKEEDENENQVDDQVHHGEISNNTTDFRRSERSRKPPEKLKDCLHTKKQ